MRLWFAFLLACTVIAVASPSRADIQTVCTMSGAFVEGDGRTVHATLDLGHDNSDERLLDSDYYFYALAVDTGGNKSVYGLELLDKKTGQVYAFAAAPTAEQSESLTAVVSGGEFLGDGALSCVALTSAVDASQLRKQMTDASASLHVLSSSFEDLTPQTQQTALLGQISAASGSTVTTIGPGVGEQYSVPAGVHGSDLGENLSWAPTDLSKPTQVSVAVPAGSSGTLYWTQSETSYVRRVTLRYGGQGSNAAFVKQRTFDVPIIRYGPVLLSTTQPTAPVAAQSSDADTTIAAAVRGLFFTSGEQGDAPVYKTIALDSAAQPATDGPKLIPVAGQDMLAITIGTTLLPQIESAEWSDGQGGEIVQSVSSDTLTVPPPTDASQPVDLRLREMDGSVLDRKISLPQSIDWANPAGVTVDFAVLDGIDSLDQVLGANKVWPGDTTIANTCFVMIPETSLYAPMLLLPKSMAPDYRAAMLKQLQETPAEMYTGRNWGMWGRSYDVYTVPNSGLSGLFGNLEAALGNQADIGFTTFEVGSPFSTEFVRLLPSTAALPPLTAPDVAISIGVAAHESFHAFMIRREIAQVFKDHPPIAGAISQKATTSTIKRSYNIDNELDSSRYVDAIADFVKGVESSAGPAKIALYRRAITERGEAVAKLPAGAADELAKQEDQEGPATYVGMTTAQILAGAPIPLNDRVPGGFGSIKTAPRGGRIPLLYQVGYLMCIALSDIEPGWQTTWMNNTKSLAQMLQEDLAVGKAGK